MPRANRLFDGGGIFHLTHRCHNRAFLLKFARDRDLYRAKLREHLRECGIGLLDYCLTSNHVHLLVDVETRSQTSELIRQVAGEFARCYNRRKERQNAFWGDNFHATVIEGGDYLWRCLCYIELNMVRAGVVKHPQEWEWSGYHEIMGSRRRYRLLDLERLCWRLGSDRIEDVRRNLEVSLRERIERDEAAREPHWTESIAIGSRPFVAKIEPLIVSRREMEMVEYEGQGWLLREGSAPYG